VSERGTAFDAAVVLYEAEQQKFLDLIDQPDKSESVSDYRAKLDAALKAQMRAHKAIMAAWADA